MSTPWAPDLAEPDYRDAFELRWSEPDHHTALEWVRAGLEGAPRALRAVVVLAHRRVLGLRLGPLGSPEHVLGWPIVSDTDDELVLAAHSWLLDARIEARRVGDTAARLTTSLRYRGRPAGAVWTLVGPVHRLVAPYLLGRAGALLGVQGAEPARRALVSRRSRSRR